MFILRPYDPQKDATAIPRIWHEVGWMSERTPEKEAAANRYVTSGKTLVAELNGTAECQVSALPGTMRYLETELRFSGVAAVATSHVARKQGLAARLTARLIAEEAAAGVQVMGLSMFEQGFYNRLGFGSAPYAPWIGFDPAQLRVTATVRPPSRITVEDWAAVHAARLTRLRGHGACTLFSAEQTRTEMLYTHNGFGLGYCDGPEGGLSHYVWMSSEGENGPYNVSWITFQTGAQLLELLALLHALGDQVRLIRMKEPYGVQLQDFIRQPFRFRQLTAKGNYENYGSATAYHQYRLCDLRGCLAETHLPGETVRFNLVLTDPVSTFLEDDAPWRGLTGEYVVTLGPESAAVPGTDPALPTLTASVGAFTRMWLGVRQPSRLALSDALAGPASLLAALDRVLRLPVPDMDWDF